MFLSLSSQGHLHGPHTTPNRPQWHLHSHYITQPPPGCSKLGVPGLRAFVCAVSCGGTHTSSGKPSLILQPDMALPPLSPFLPASVCCHQMFIPAAISVMSVRDFLGGPVAKTPCSQCRGPRFDPWSGNWIPCVTVERSRATTKTWYGQINKEKFF